MNSFYRDKALNEAAFLEAIINVVDKHSNEGSSSSVHSYLSYFISQIRKLDLERSLVLILLNFHF